MIDLPELAVHVQGADADGTSLAALVDSPTSQAVVGILARRCEFEAELVASEALFDLCRCSDKSDSGLAIPSPFGTVCIDTTHLRTESQAQAMYRRLTEVLGSRGLSQSIVIVISSSGLGPLGTLTDVCETTFVHLPCPDAVGVLLAHPPRAELMRHVVAKTPLSQLNPYVYKGPVYRALFVGRVAHLRKLRSQEASYSLIGPRCIGKTSLLNRVYERLRAEGEIAIRVEVSPAMSENDLVTELIRRFVREYGDAPSRLGRVSVKRLENLVESRATKHGKIRRTVRFLIDEADELSTKCPQLLSAFRRCHNHGWARFVFAGYTGLRRAMSDVAHSAHSNFATPLYLGAITRRAAGALIVRPMIEMAIDLENPDGIVDVIYRETGGAPSRIQLLCHFLVENLSEAAARRLTVADAKQAIELPGVHAELMEWFHASTTSRGRWLAGVARLKVPCVENDLIQAARAHVPELTSDDISGDVQDLITANVLTYLLGRRIDFTFPAMRELALPSTDATEAMNELSNMVRRELSQGERRAT